MKKIILLLLIIVFNTGLKASEYSGYSMEIKSREHHNINGSFFFFVKITFNDSIKFRQNLELVLPSNWSYTTNKNITKKYYTTQDTLNIKVTVNYPISQIPFYATRIQIKEITDSKTTDKEIIKSITGMIYFTPYNSVEIWNMTDYYNLPRKWLEPDTNSTTQPQRISFLKSSIPISDLLNKPENWLEDNKDLFYGECREIEVNGLGYRVLMSPVTIDSISYYEQIGDGPDSTDTSGLKAGKVFSGSVTARFTANIINDLGQEKIIPLVGIRVKLLERDFWGFQDFGESTTDENGYVTISYSRNQIGEGNNIELRLRYKSEVPEFDITSSNWIGNKYEYDSHEWSSIQTEYGQNAGTQTLTMRTWTDVKNEAFTGIHWARKGFKTFQNNNISIASHLRIKINSNSTYFTQYNFESTIHLASNKGNTESAIYHEFGHFVMYRLRGNYDPPYLWDINAPDLEHSFNEENHPTLAFSEGWADAIRFILDASNWNEDYEYGYQRSVNIDNLINYGPESEFINVYSNINNGFRSEYLIACAIYDLWDGSDKNLPVNFIATSYSGWDESNQPNSKFKWNSIDNVSFSLYDICNPLTSWTSGSVPELYNDKTIINYFNSFISGKNYCTRSKISRVFRENGVQYSIDNYTINFLDGFINQGYNSSSLNTDFIYIQASENIWGMLQGGLVVIMGLNFNYDNINILPLNTYSYSPTTNDVQYITDLLWVGVHDDKNTPDITDDEIRTTIVKLNNNIGSAGVINALYQTCTDVEIDIRNGILECGGDNTTAELTIVSGSTLKIRQNGSLIIHDNSTVIIECGAKFEVENGAQIELLGPNARLIIYGTFDVPPYAYFSTFGQGTVSFYSNNEIILPSVPGHIFNVENGSSLSMASANRILLNPGFHAKQGSYFRAYIDTSIPYCNNEINNKVILSGNSDSDINDNIVIEENYKELESEIITNNNVNNEDFINVFPNPVSSKIFIENINPINTEPNYIKQVSLFNTLGNKFYEKNYSDVNNVVIETSFLQNGIYILKITTDKRIEIKQIIVNNK